MNLYHKVLLGLGSNEAGSWDEPVAALTRALRELEANGVRLSAVSRFEVTRPVGPIPQPSYVNAAAAGRTEMDANGLLVLLKRLEHEAGRRPGPRWGPRPLDIDILDFDGVVLGWDAAHDPMRPAHLVLPHPELHKRAFVLEPLAGIAPAWLHPVLGKNARQMLADLAAST